MTMTAPRASPSGSASYSAIGPSAVDSSIVCVSIGPPVFVATPMGSCLLQGLRGDLDRFDDALVSRAAAQVARQSFTDLVERRVRILLQECLHRHDEARG